MYSIIKRQSEKWRLFKCGQQVYEFMGRCGGQKTRLILLEIWEVPLSRTKKVRTGRDLWTDQRKRHIILVVVASVSPAMKIGKVTSEVRVSTGDENGHSLVLPNCRASQLQTSVIFKQFFIHRLTEMNKLAEWLITVTCQHDHRKDRIIQGFNYAKLPSGLPAVHKTKMLSLNAHLKMAFSSLHQRLYNSKLRAILPAICNTQAN